jgi:hypothetical protein
LQKWEKPSGSPANEAVRTLLRDLFRIYGAMGGRLEVTWDANKERPTTPLAKFLTVIYLALPDGLRRTAASSASAFVVKAGRAQSKRWKGVRGATMLVPVTDAAWRAELDRQAEWDGRPAEAKRLSSWDRDE